LISTLILKGPNWNLPFHIHIDALEKSLGVVLGQHEVEERYTIYFINKNLTRSKLNYTVTQKEFLVVVNAIDKFQHYIIGYIIFAHTDHTMIRYLMNKPIISGRVVRWLLLLQ
jgi:hypothetical protein